jgi:signal peptidase II
MVGITVAVVLADQVTKALVAAGKIADGSSFGWVTVQVLRNHGASGGLASGYPVLVTLSALAVTALAATLAVKASGRLTALCLAAVLGGALGNLADRVFRSPGLGRGGVVDWIHFAGGGGSLDLSDLAIQFGVLGAIAGMLLAGRVRKSRQGQEAESAADRQDPPSPRPHPHPSGGA